MTKYILHGGYELHQNELNAGFHAEIVKDIPENSQVLIVFLQERKKNMKYSSKKARKGSLIMREAKS